MNRRDFLSRSLWTMGAAGALSAGLYPKTLSAQAQNKTIHGNKRYDKSLIFERKPTFSWPGGKTLAIWVIPNVEVWHFDSTAGGAIGSTSPVAPDVMNYAWREYGMRVGLWRIAEAMDSLGIRATVALNSGVCEEFPKAIEQMKKLKWEFMGHGITNSQNLSSKMNFDEENELVQTVVRVIEQATGKKPRGWLGPGLAESFNTPDILAAHGIEYVGDWNNDDQPYPMKVKKGNLTALPYSLELNDMTLLFRRGYTGDQYLKVLTDQFDTLYNESKKLPKAMGVPLHPFLAGQPWRTKYLSQALAQMQKQPGVWFATGSEILDAYRSSQP